MGGGDDADAEIQLLVADGNLDPAVLRPPPLGNVHFGKDFYAGDDGT